MKVLQFAFAPGEDSEYLPHNYPVHCVAYPGTHDNTTAAGWLAGAEPDEAAKAKAYLGLNKAEGLVRGFVRGVLASPAELAVVPMADWLGLGEEGRINTPGILGGGNWAWRCPSGAFTPALAADIRARCQVFGRCAGALAQGG